MDVGLLVRVGVRAVRGLFHTVFVLLLRLTLHWQLEKRMTTSGENSTPSPD